MPATRADLQTEIASLRKYIKDRSDSLAELKPLHDVASVKAAKQVQDAIDTAKSKLRDDEILLAELESKRGPTPISPHPFFVHPKSLSSSSEKAAAVPPAASSELPAPKT